MPSRKQLVEEARARREARLNAMIKNHERAEAAKKAKEAAKIKAEKEAAAAKLAAQGYGAGQFLMQPKSEVETTKKLISDATDYQKMNRKAAAKSPVRAPLKVTTTPKGEVLPKISTFTDKGKTKAVATDILGQEYDLTDPIDAEAANIAYNKAVSFEEEKARKKARGKAGEAEDELRTLAYDRENEDKGFLEIVAETLNDISEGTPSYVKYLNPTLATQELLSPFADESEEEYKKRLLGYAAYEAEQAVDHERLAARTNYRNQNANGFLENAWAGIANFFEGAGETITQGETWKDSVEKKKNETLDKIREKIEKYGVESLTKEERLFASSKAFRSEIENQNPLAASAEFGEGMGLSVPFMLDIAVTLGAATATGGLGILKGATTIAKGARLLNKLSKAGKVGKIAAGLAGAVGKSAATLGLTQVDQTIADFYRRKSGDVVFDEQGNVKFINGTSTLEAATDAIVSGFIENFTETAGGVVAGIGGKVISKIPGTKKITEWVSKNSLGDMINFFNKASNQRHVKKVFDAVQLQGFSEEYLEEVTGEVLNAAFVGDVKWDDIANVKHQTHLFLGTAATTGFFRSAGVTVGGVASMHENRKRGRAIKKVDNLLQTSLGEEKWGNIRSTIDTSENDNLEEATLSALQGEGLSQKEKTQILQYATLKAQDRGAKAGEMLRYAAGQVTPEDRQTMGDFLLGYELETPEERQAVHIALSQAEADAAKALQQMGVDATPDEVLEQYGDTPEKQLRAITQDREFLGEALTPLFDYAQGSVLYEGVLRRSKDNIDERVEDAQARSQEMLHDSGSIIQVQLEGDSETYYLVSGEVANGKEGELVPNSTSLVVRNATTREAKMVSPKRMKVLDLVDKEDVPQFIERYVSDVQRQAIEEEKIALAPTTTTTTPETEEATPSKEGTTKSPKESNVPVKEEQQEEFDPIGEKIEYDGRTATVLYALNGEEYTIQFEDDGQIIAIPKQEAKRVIEEDPQEDISSPTPKPSIEEIKEAKNYLQANRQRMAEIEEKHAKSFNDLQDRISAVNQEEAELQEMKSQLRSNLKFAFSSEGRRLQAEYSQRSARLEQEKKEIGVRMDELLPVQEEYHQLQEQALEAEEFLSENKEQEENLQNAVEKQPQEAKGNDTVQEEEPQQDYSALVEQLLQDEELSDEERIGYINANLFEAKKKLEKLQSKAPNMGTSIDEYKQKRLAYRIEQQKAEEEVAYWENAKKDTQQILQLEEPKEEAQEELYDTAVLLSDEGMFSLEDMIMYQLSNIKLTYPSARKETGLKATDLRRGFRYYTPEKGGVSIEKASEIIWDNLTEEQQHLFGDNNNIRSHIIEAVKAGISPKRYFGNRAKELQEKMSREKAAYEQELKSQEAAQRGFDTVEEMELYDEQVLSNAIRNQKDTPEIDYEVEIEREKNEGNAEEVTEDNTEAQQKGVFGTIYTQFRGKPQEAIKFLMERKEGEAVGALHRKEIGDIDLIWGDANMGLAHIVQKHIEEVPDFSSIDEAAAIIEKVVTEGDITKETNNRFEITQGNYKVAVRKTFDEQDKKWVVTAFDYVTPIEEKKKGSVTLSTPNQTAEAVEAGAVASNLSTDKVTQSSEQSHPQEKEFTPSARSQGEDLFGYAQRVANEVEEHNKRKVEETKVNTSPSEAQKEAGNYKKGHIKVDGLDITIEQPKGSVRSGKDASGKEWRTEMKNTYGYIRGTQSVDGDHIDIFLSDNPNSGSVFVVDQVNKDGGFDEHKVMYGFPDEQSAREAYLSNYAEGWQGLGAITEVSKEDFKKWIKSSKRKTKPFAEYKQNSKGKNKKKSEKKQEEKKSPHTSENTIVTEERYKELVEQMRKKLRGQMNIGIDPEIFSIGVQMAVYHIEKGARSFQAYAKAMLDEMEELRPYLKSFYNGVRDLPEVQETSWANELTPYEEVRSIDISSIGKENAPTILEKAEQVASEYKVEKQVEKIKSDNPDFMGDLFSQVEETREELVEDHKEVKENIKEESKKEEAKETEEVKENKKFQIPSHTITPATYTTKAGKVLNMFLLKFIERLDSPAWYLAKRRAEKVRGWSDNNKKGFMMRSYEDAEELAKSILPKDEYVPTTRPSENQEEKIESVNKEEDTDTTNQFESKKVDTSSLFGELHKKGEAKLSDHIEEKTTQKTNKEERTEDTQEERKLVEQKEEFSTKEEDTSNQTRVKNRNNFSSTSEIAPKSEHERYKANIQAIKLSRQIIQEDRPATKEEQKKLSSYSGWGGLGSYLGNRYTKIDLEEAGLSTEEINSLHHSVNSAYYTPAEIINTLWGVAKQLGFNGGNILEGSAGIGSILAYMPQQIKNNSNITAVEIDETTSGILSLLYPDAVVHNKGFEKTNIPPQSIDLAITNVPFETGLSVYDPRNSDLSKRFKDIQDFAIAKNIRSLKEGGIGIFITSKGTLDKSTHLRQWIVGEGNTDFIGAFRLNNSTFQGTGVTSDIIVVQKRIDGKPSPHRIDLSTSITARVATYSSYDSKGKETKKEYPLIYNSYFQLHPEMMAGEMKFAFEQGDTWRPTSTTLSSEGVDQNTALKTWVGTFKKTEQSVSDTTEEQEAPQERMLKEGEMLIDEKGNLAIVRDGRISPLEINKNKVKGQTKQKVFEDYLRIKQAVENVLTSQTNNSEREANLLISGDELEVKRLQKIKERIEGKTFDSLLEELNSAYDSFVAKYGSLNKNPNLAFLRKDMEYPMIAAIEKYEETSDKEGKKVIKTEKTDIFFERVLNLEPQPTPSTAKEALIISINTLGEVSFPLMGQILERDSESIKEELLSKGEIYLDPASGEYSPRHIYLSGDVREKLSIAEAHNEEGKFQPNIDSLKKVVPPTIPATLINYSLGSTWLPTNLLREFFQEKFDVDFTPIYAGGKWALNNREEHRLSNSNDKNRSAGVYSEVVREHKTGAELAMLAMNNKNYTFSKRSKDGKYLTDQEASRSATIRIEEIKEEFSQWMRDKVTQDEKLSDKLEELFNKQFNSFVPIEFDDTTMPKHLVGATNKITLKPHQKRAVARAVISPTMLAHEVGSGKTFTLISIAMEMRRLGTAKKPMIVVQNATLSQFVSSAKKLYPNAKILTLGDSDRGVEGRYEFYGKIRYNDWDMVVIPQSTFERIADSPEIRQLYISEKIREKEATLLGLSKKGDKKSESLLRREIENLKKEISAIYQNSEEAGENKKERKQKDVEKSKRNAAAKAERQIERNIDSIFFDDLDIDALLIDEAHEFKNLPFETSIRGVKGISPTGSNKAVGAYLKVMSVLRKTGGRNIVLATGTPISNTAAELWTFMRYLMPQEVMQTFGISYFDDFIRNFGKISTVLEFATNGKFKENQRFVAYENIPELIRIWSMVSDTVLTKDMSYLSEAVPQIENNSPQDVFLAQSPSLIAIMNFLRRQLEAYELLSGQEKKENSHIPITSYGIGARAAIDPRLVHKQAPDEEVSKTNEAVSQTIKALKDSEEYRGTVAIFSDAYQNKESGFNLFHEIKRKLTEKGVPESEIIIMEGTLSPEKKEKIFAKVNAGEIRVILGTTQRLGVGVNIQERLFALMHLDAPNRPMDYEQRNGRIIRQGNLHKDWETPVRVIRFGVEDSLDVTAYQRLKTKSAFINSVMDGKKLLANPLGMRSIEEDESGVFNNPVAVLSGSQYQLLIDQAEREVKKWESKKKQHEADQSYILKNLTRIYDSIKKFEYAKEKAEKDLEKVKELFGENNTSISQINGNDISNPKLLEKAYTEVNKLVEDKFTQFKNGYDVSKELQIPIVIGNTNVYVTVHFNKSEEFVKGGIAVKSTRSMSVSIPEAEIKNIPTKSRFLKGAIEFLQSEIIIGNTLINTANSAGEYIEKMKSEISSMEERKGKPFEHLQELFDARARVQEYKGKMVEEMKAKEAKQKELLSHTEVPILDMSKLINTIEDEEEENYRDAGEESEYEYLRKTASERENEERANAITSVAQSLGVKVKVITSEKELKEDSPRKQNAKGWYKDGSITIVLPNHTTTEDAMATLWHEAVGHLGVRELAKRAGMDYDTMLTDIYNNLDLLTKAKVQAKRVDYKKRFGKEVSVAYAMDEYLAEMAESGDFKASIIDKIRSFVHKLLHALGFDGLTLHDNDLRYILAQSHNLLTNKGAIAAANKIALEQRFKKKQTQPIRNDIIERLRNSQEAVITGDEVKRSSDLKEYKRNALEYGKQLQGAYKNLDTGIIIQLQRGRKNGGIKEVLQHNYKDNIHLQSVAAIPQIIEKGILVKREANKDKETNPNVKDYLHFVVGLRINGESYTAHAIVAEDSNGNRYYDHNLIEIEKERLLDLVQGKAILYEGFGTTPDTESTTLNNYKDKRLFSILQEAKLQQEESINYRDRATPSKGLIKAAEAYDKKISSSRYQAREALQDSDLSLISMYKAVLGKPKDFVVERDVADHENTYVHLNKLPGKSKEAVDNYNRWIYKPLIEAVKKLGNQKEVETYLMAKHGLERNIYMAEREAEKKSEKGTPQYNKDYAKARERDYSGITALMEEESVAEAEVAATKLIEEYEQKHGELIDELWENVRRATREAVKIQYEGGLIDKNTYQDIVSMYQYYVPLRGFDEKTTDDEYAYFSVGRGGAWSDPIQKAKGRSSKADSPLANIGVMANTSIRQATENKAKQTLYAFAVNHPSDLLSVSDMWLVKDDVDDIWEAKTPDYPADATAEEMRTIAREFDRNMRRQQKEHPDRYKQHTPSTKYRISDRALKEHQVIVAINGHLKVITVNGNPRVAQTVNGVATHNRHFGRLDTVLKLNDRLKRWLSMAYTTISVEFIHRNFARDGIYTNSLVWVKESPEYAAKYNKNYTTSANVVNVGILLHKYINGQLDDSKEIDRHFKLFMMEGGETGYTSLNDIDRYKKRLERELKSGVMVSAGNVISLLVDKLSNTNRAIELSPRFAAYLTSRQVGRSVTRSIYDAKEISTNFNRRGAGAAYANKAGTTVTGKTIGVLSELLSDMFIFFNANVQGNTGLARVAYHNKGKSIPLMAAILALAAIGYLSKGWSDDGDDEYDYVPDAMRQQNILIRYGGDWIRIPLPPGYRSIYAAAHQFLRYKDGKATAEELSTAAGAVVLDNLPVDLSGGSKSLVPSIAKPFVEVATNESWMGTPIYKDSDYNKNQPEHEAVYKGANKFWVEASRQLNSLTGGDDVKRGAVSINPAGLDYILRATMGGAYKEFERAMRLATEDEFELKNIPILGASVSAFTLQGGDKLKQRATKNKYYEYLDEYKTTNDLLRGYTNGYIAGHDEYLQKREDLLNSPEGRRYKILHQYDNANKIISAKINKIHNLQPDNHEAITAWEDKQYQIMEEAVQQLKAIK